MHEKDVNDVKLIYFVSFHIMFLLGYFYTKSYVKNVENLHIIIICIHIYAHSN